MITKQKNILEHISSLTVINQLVETIYVNSSSGEIEVSKTVKEDDAFKHTSEKIRYKLKSHRFIVKCHKVDQSTIVISDRSSRNHNTISNKPVHKCMSTDINGIFISELESFKNLQKFNYNFFKRNMLMKLMSPKRDHHLIDHIIEIGSDCSWTIVPIFIFDIIKDSELFESSNIESESLIYNAGKIEGINIYVNPEEERSIIYFGNYDSITIIINRNIKEEDIKTTSFLKEGKIMYIDYTFLESGLTKSLTIS